MRVRQIGPFWPPFLILVAAFAVIAMFVAQTLAISGANERQLALSSALASQIVPQNIYKPTIRIWVHGDSIRPRIIRTRPGVVVLRAENETRSNVSLVFERVLLGETVPVATITTTNGGRRARRELTLEAGEYVYYDAARPRIKGSLIVELPGR